MKLNANELFKEMADRIKKETSNGENKLYITGIDYLELVEDNLKERMYLVKEQKDLMGVNGTQERKEITPDELKTLMSKSAYELLSK